jgi:hypothetical protein
VTLEDICSVEALLGGRARSGTESTDHGPFVVSEGVSVFVILAGESFQMVIAVNNRALFRALALVSEHVSFQVLERAATIGKRASALLAALVLAVSIASRGTRV